MESPNRLSAFAQAIKKHPESFAFLASAFALAALDAAGFIDAIKRAQEFNAIVDQLKPTIGFNGNGAHLEWPIRIPGGDCRLADPLIPGVEKVALDCLRSLGDSLSSIR
jgi:hypothetical protein